MSSVGAPRHDPVPIGVVAALAAGHLLAPYLRFLASLSDIQHRLQDGLAQPDMPNEGDGKRAREFGMPPLDRGRFISDAAFEATLERLLTLAEAIDMPEPARAALARTKAGDDAARAAMVRAVLTDAIPVEQLADHLFVAAALQVHFARQAAHLNGKDLVPVGNGVCPACGAPPVASMIVGWSGSNNTRFCACSLCTTQWNYVRIKCTLCGSTEAISYKHVEDGDRLVRAETCESCRGYVKILQHLENPALEPMADDAAGLALDMLVREMGYRRGAVNPFLMGY